MLGLSPDEHYIWQALELARKGEGYTSPNPAVGALVVDAQGQVIGRGYHQQAGGPHAEVLALREAGDAAEGCTLYVTLEPCCHYGKTPPCTELIINRRLARVVWAADDPNPLVAGRSAALLEAAGIDVTSGVLCTEARKLNRYFEKHIREQFPWVTLKSAVTLDGRVALDDGQSKWITAQDARIDAHLLRGLHDAICVGITTVLADNPLLSYRNPHRQLPDPHVIIFDSRLRTPPQAALFERRGRQVFILCDQALLQSPAARVLEQAGAQVLGIPVAAPGRLDVVAGLQRLYREFQICSVLIEGGSQLAATVLRQRLEDELILYVAPKLFGQGVGLCGDLGIRDPEAALEFQLQDVQRIGDDLRLRLQRRSGDA